MCGSNTRALPTAECDATSASTEGRMAESKSGREAFAEGLVGVSRNELEDMPDVELAIWQAGWETGTGKHILAEKEWTRRLSMRQLREQFRLEEQVAKVGRWWSVGAAVIGVVGTLVGAALGAWLQASMSSPITPAARTHPSEAKAQGTPPAAQQPAPSASSPSLAPRAAPAASSQ